MSLGFQNIFQLQFSEHGLRIGWINKQEEATSIW